MLRAKRVKVQVKLKMQKQSSGGVFCEKVVLENFPKFTWKHLSQNLFFNNFIKKETLTQVFPCEFFEISKNTSFYRTPPVAAAENTKMIL